MNNLNVSSVSL